MEKVLTIAKYLNRLTVNLNITNYPNYMKLFLMEPDLCNSCNDVLYVYGVIISLSMIENDLALTSNDFIGGQ